MKDRLIFFLAVNTGFATNGVPDSRFLDFYKARSSHALHCAIVGNIVVPGGYGSNSTTPEITELPFWGQLVDTIRLRGSLPGIQLATTWENYTGQRKFVSSTPAAPIELGRARVAGMTSDEVAKVLTAFESGADIAVRHGFLHIQLHAGHGYLLGLLIDGRLNPRSGIVIERLSKLSERLRGKGVETSIRISMRSGDPEFDESGNDEFHNEIAAMPFDYIDLSSGYYNIDKRLIYPARPEIVDARFQESLAVGARHPNRSFIISARKLTQNWDEVPHNLHPGICRDLIANPRFLEELENGCRNSGKCHYYSRGDSHITCGRWTSK